MVVFGGTGGGLLDSSESSGKVTTDTIKKTATARATKTATQTSPRLPPLPLTPPRLEAKANPMKRQGNSRKTRAKLS